MGTLLLATGTFVLAWEARKEIRSHSMPVISGEAAGLLKVTPQAGQPASVAKGSVWTTLQNIGPGPACNLNARSDEGAAPFMASAR